MKYLIAILISLPVLGIIYLLKDTICKYLKLIDYATHNTLHKKDGLLYGGIFLLAGYLLNFYFLFFSLNNLPFYNIYLVIFFFLLALIDDIKNLTANKKFLISIIIICFCIYYDPALKIYSLNFSLFGIIYFPNNLFVYYFFTCLCILLLINAINFTDGINGLTSLISLSIFTYLIIKNYYLFDYLFIFLLFLLVFITLNLFKNIFLGDSGNYIISSIISIILIKENYYSPQKYFAEEIFLLLLVPGIDMFRLFIVRLLDKKNPMLGDRNHLHHILLKKYGLKNTLVIYLMLVNIPIYSYYFSQNYLITLVCLVIMTYAFLIRNKYL
jgi:UDP-GlcNAc:undecaprenyl-phosphate GlcNAc-1-phosphate transferase